MVLLAHFPNEKSYFIVGGLELYDVYQVFSYVPSIGVPPNSSWIDNSYETKVNFNQMPGCISLLQLILL